MKKYFLCAGILCALASNAQNLSLSSQQLDFNAVNYPDKDSIQLDITNDFDEDIAVEKIQFFEKYGNQVYSVSEDQFTITQGQTKSVWVYFEPEHNIIYNSEMVITTDYRGSVAVDLTGEGKFSSYYSSTFNKSEEDLKSTLKTLLAQGYTNLGYNSARDKMFMEFDNQKLNGQGAAVNTLEGVYTGQLVTNYNSRSDAQNQGFNTEHTFPQGMFSSSEPMKSDLHHLFPTNSTANSQRGNLPFGVVSGSASWSVGGSKKGGGVFEPRDVHKGAVARAMFYFVIRYQNYNSFLNGQESILRTWHYDDMPDQIDINRNEAISLLQKNRNPFIDYPQILERITSISSNSVEADNWSMYLSDDTLDLTTGNVVTDDEAHYVIVNHGNQAIQIENFALTGNVEFDHAQSDLLLLPGEAHQLTIRATPGTGGTGALTYETNVSGQQNVTVHLVLPKVDPDHVGEVKSTSFSVFPIPATDVITVKSSRPTKMIVSNVMGEIVFEKQVHNGDKIDAQAWARGVYFVSYQENSTFETITIKID